MSIDTWSIEDDDEQDEDGFWYRKNPNILGLCPPGWDADLNVTTVGWRRYRSASGGIVETIRLPEEYRWLEVGTATVSADGRTLTRDVEVPDRTNGHTIFHSSGYLHDYFTFHHDKRRIERFIG